jgi:hypothetical protein
VAAHLLATHFPGCEPTLKDSVSSPKSVNLPSEEDWLKSSRIISEDYLYTYKPGRDSYETTANGKDYQPIYSHFEKIPLHESQHADKGAGHGKRRCMILLA